MAVGGGDNVVRVASGVKGGWSSNDDRIGSCDCAGSSCSCRH